MVARKHVYATHGRVISLHIRAPLRYRDDEERTKLETIRVVVMKRQWQADEARYTSQPRMRAETSGLEATIVSWFTERSEYGEPSRCSTRPPASVRTSAGAA